MYDQILIPLDGSERAETALEHAAGLAERFGSRIHLLQVVTLSPQIAAAVAPGETMAPSNVEVIESVIEEDAEKARVYLAEVADGLTAKGFAAEWAVVRGSAAEEIVRWAHDHNVDLVVIATRGRSGLSRLVLGSVADEVVRNGKLPVLLIAVS